MGPKDGTSQEGSFGPTAHAVVAAERHAEACPKCRDGFTALVEIDGAPLYGVCARCNHRWHIWPMSGRWEHLRQAAQKALAGLE